MVKCKEFQNRPKAIKLAITFFTSIIAAFAILFFYHQEAVTGAPTQEFTTNVGVIAQQLDRTGNAMLREQGFLPRIKTIRRAIDENPIHTFLIAVGILIALGELFNPSKRLRSIVLIAFILPLLSLLIYRNAFPYFLVYILPTALIITGLTVERLIAMEFPNRNQAATTILFVLAIALPVLSINLIFERMKDGISHQRTLITAIHEIFPHPVSYIDAHQMVSSFPSHGLFFSTLGMKSYRQSGRPIMRHLLEQNKPQFLLANIRALQIDQRYRDLGINSLFKEDYMTLRDNFIHHWGPIFVPGKEFQIQIDHLQSGVSFEILIPGLYSVESEKAVRLNGNLLDPGCVLWLSVGHHHLQATPGLVRLRWGDRLKRPEATFIRKPLYIPL